MLIHIFLNFIGANFLILILQTFLSYFVGIYHFLSSYGVLLLILIFSRTFFFFLHLLIGVSLCDLMLLTAISDI